MSVNKVILVGNLGKDPEVRYLESGVAVANFPIATSEKYKDRNTGERITQTEWHNVVVWRGLAEVAEKFLKKGNQVYIEGKLRTRSWEDQNGQKKYTTEIVADNMTMLGGAKEGLGANQSENRVEETMESSEVEKTEPVVAAASAASASVPSDSGSKSDDDPFNDDLPF